MRSLPAPTRGHASTSARASASARAGRANRRRRPAGGCRARPPGRPPPQQRSPLPRLAPPPRGALEVQDRGEVGARPERVVEPVEADGDRKCPLQARDRRTPADPASRPRRPTCRARARARPRRPGPLDSASANRLRARCSASLNEPSSIRIWATVARTRARSSVSVRGSISRARSCAASAPSRSPLSQRKTPRRSQAAAADYAVAGRDPGSQGRFRERGCAARVARDERSLGCPAKKRDVRMAAAD